MIPGSHTSPQKRHTVPQGGKSKIVMELEVNLSFPFNFLMGFMIKMQLGGLIKDLHEEIVFYIENNGEPHSRKTKALQKLNHKVA